MASSDGSPLPARIGNYEVLERLAVGGMAEVYLGRSTGAAGFEKLVAIKRVRPHLARVPSFVEMFLDEARIAAKLNHSNIVQIFDLGEADDTYYIAMEYVPGVSLSELHHHFENHQSRASGPLAAMIMMNVCLALDHAHTKRDSDGSPLNIIHRDVSPSNVVVSFEGEIKLIDFGIVKARLRLHHTQSGLIKGKRGYISPEQARGESADVRSDVFAAGMVLHGLLSQRRPGSDPDDRWPYPPPSVHVAEVPPALEAICVRAIEHDPARRYQSAAAMGADLEEYHHQHPFTRHQLAAWMKESFQASYELQRRSQGLGPPELVTAPTFPPAMLPALRREGVDATVETVAVVSRSPRSSLSRSTEGPDLEAPTAVLTLPSAPVSGPPAELRETLATVVGESPPPHRSLLGPRLAVAGASILVGTLAALLFSWIGSTPSLDLRLDRGVPPPPAPTINLAAPAADHGIAEVLLDASARYASASDLAIAPELASAPRAAPSPGSMPPAKPPILRRRKDRKVERKHASPETTSSEKSKPDASRPRPRPKLPYQSL
jgi:serine/threonine protein kinase